MSVTVANKEMPPDDDVCPVCFGEFVLPCRANCGHWFCGSCILQVWNFSSAFQACKCPMCYSHIKSLKLEVSPHLQDEEEARKVLKSIERYNQLFVRGAQGFFLKLYDIPRLLRRMFNEVIMTDPNQVDMHADWICRFASMLGSYMTSHYKFMIEGEVSRVNVYLTSISVGILCCLAVLFVVSLLKLAGSFQRRRSAERVRRLAAMGTPVGGA